MSNRLRNKIEEIRTKTEMYIGNRSVHRFKWFIDGYFHALYDSGVSEDEKNLYQKIRETVYKRTTLKINKGWAEHLDFISSNEFEALDMFWELWDMYIITDRNISWYGQYRCLCILHSDGKRTCRQAACIGRSNGHCAGTAGKYCARGL